jgi:UDP-N-acetylglucosamine 2-epimerase (non-hydrolysing)/UDP-GlcNAc3NAcA epimerase
MKIVTIVGARPQFIKTSMVSNLLREYHQEVLVHTGQHFDDNMSAVFFEKLNIPKPNYNLGIAGGSHGSMTGRMLAALDELLTKERPDGILLYGDTNSTLAGALSAVKLHIPVWHIEAGLRFGTLINPEEVNRVLTDRISEKLFCPVKSAVNNLEREGITDNVHFTGDVMYDAYLNWSPFANISRLIGLEGEAVNVPEYYYYLTVHREENQDKLEEVFRAMSELDALVIYPVHPRNKKRAKALNPKNVYLTEPVGYLESLALLNGCKQVITDSGGLQREAFFAGKKCVTLLEHKLWPETHTGNRNLLSQCDADEIVSKLSVKQTIETGYSPFGVGRAADKIVNIISKSAL